MGKLELWQLRQRQGLDLNTKIKLTERRITSFYDYYEGQIYTSFSGGKDSLVLQNLVWKKYPDSKSVFVNTGLEYPEIIDFVKQFDVKILRPEMVFNKVIEKYGYPVVSKSISQKIEEIRITKSEKLRNLRLNGSEKGRASKLSEKWKYLIDAPFKISARCCDVMKKRPFKKFEKKTGLHPFIGTMASDSRNREIAYLKSGCNSFDNGRSQPLSFWKTEDIWAYIKKEKLKYCKIYDMGVKNTGCMFCLFGIQFDGCNNRFQCMQRTHPLQYKFCMEKLGVKEVLDFMDVPYTGFQEVLQEPPSDNVGCKR